MNYPLGSSLIPRVGVRRERWPGGCDLRASSLIYEGAHVEPDQPIMRLERSKTSATLSQAPRLSLPASTDQGLPEALSSRAQPQSEIILAGLRGTVVRVTRRGSVVIEGQVALVAGVLGVGRQVAGPLTIWQAPRGQEQPLSIPPGAIVVVPGPLNLAMLEQALNSQIGGIVASSISSRDFERFVRIDLIDLLHRANTEFLLSHLPPLTVMLTEGLGTKAMPVRTIDLLSKHQGRIALLSGATSLSTHVYPELLMALSLEEQQKEQLALKPETDLTLGALVRVCSGNYEGTIGVIDYLFTHTQRFPSGVRARAARIRLEDSSQLVVPLPILERIG